jgi:hypothetical protein
MNPLERKLLGKYSRAIIHMRDQIQLNRFGLVFGAGIGCQFGFPKWKEFMDRIATHEKILGSDLTKISGSNTDVGQMLFQRLKINNPLSEPDLLEYDRSTSFYKKEWIKIIHDELYKNVPDDIQEIKSRDRYLNNYINIIKKTRLTLNYNFDDTIELLLSEERNDDEKLKTRGYRAIWNADIQLYPQNGVIYHPNGYIPRGFRERPSDDIVFLEDSFGDQLIDSISGHYRTLSNFYSQNTCLLIGLSLEDSTLKHILRYNSRIHPGHVHYYIYYTGTGVSLTEDQMNSIVNSNFEVFNLITLFLNDDEISVLGQLINTERQIGEILDQLGLKSVYRFFLTGSVCVGKSTAVSHFRSLRTHDEWLERKVKGMEKDPNRIKNKDVINEIDIWVAEQWRTKNYLLSKLDSGVHIVDRSPLDAFAFTPKEEWIAKAQLTKNIITPEKSCVKLCKGKIILLLGDPNEMSVRALKLQKDVKSDELDYRQNLFRRIYSKCIKGIVELDTKNKTIERVAKDICKIIHIDEHDECDLQEILEKIETNKINANDV